MGKGLFCVAKDIKKYLPMQSETTSTALPYRFLEELLQIFDNSRVILQPEKLHDYGQDYTEDFLFLPQVVALPENTDEVAEAVRLCNRFLIPLTVRGAGTGLSGGALPIKGGLVLSMEKMNRILEIDEQNFQARVQPGVINQVFQDTLAEKGLFYPPDPASKGSCFLGGNIAHNSGGPRALKYGVTKDYVLNLEVVTGNGDIIRTGANTLKNSTGYNLTQLMLGSEGTLGIVTEITFKLLVLPRQRLLLFAEFERAENACAAVAEIFRAGITPSALEFMERSGIEISARRLQIHFPLREQMEAYLLIEVDGNELEPLYGQLEQIHTVLERFEVGEVLMAESADEKEKLWKIRRAIGETVKAESVYKEEDTVVPRACLPELLNGVKTIGRHYGFESICYGHAGDGNLHVNILKGNLSDSFWKTELKDAIREIFELCKQLGGTISGEHGIGLVQKEYMPIVFSSTHLDLMRGIKKVFDPNGILNPGKIFPENQ